MTCGYLPDSGSADPYHEDTRHRLPGNDPLVREIRHRRDVVSQGHSALIGSPPQHLRVISRAQPDILDPDDIDAPGAALQPDDDPAVEVLVGYEANRHCPSRASNLARKPSGGNRVSTFVWTSFPRRSRSSR